VDMAGKTPADLPPRCLYQRAAVADGRIVHADKRVDKAFGSGSDTMLAEQTPARWPECGSVPVRRRGAGIGRGCRPGAPVPQTATNSSCRQRPPSPRGGGAHIEAATCLVLSGAGCGQVQGGF
jgi:hypothetical protein